MIQPLPFFLFGGENTNAIYSNSHAQGKDEQFGNSHTDLEDLSKDWLSIPFPWLTIDGPKRACHRRNATDHGNVVQ